MDSKQQEMTPLVSFIITNYNLPVNLLSKCIDSVLALSLRPSEREIILVDDGSDLSPINDLVTYGDEIIYVRQKHGGVSIVASALPVTQVSRWQEDVMCSLSMATII